MSGRTAGPGPRRDGSRDQNRDHARGEDRDDGQVTILVIGFAVAGIVVPSNTLIQQETPAALMGRVGSTVMSLIFSAQIAGLLLSGLLADHIGVRQVFTVCAVALVLLCLAGRLFMEPKTGR